MVAAGRDRRWSRRAAASPRAGGAARSPGGWPSPVHVVAAAHERGLGRGAPSGGRRPPGPPPAARLESARRRRGCPRTPRPSSGPGRARSGRRPRGRRARPGRVRAASVRRYAPVVHSPLECSMPADPPSPAASSPSRSRTGSCRTSCQACIRPRPGSWRRAWRASSGPARRRCARPCAAWRRWGRGDHALPGRARAAAVDGELLEAYVVRSELESLGARLGVPLMTHADLDGSRRSAATCSTRRRGGSPCRGRAGCGVPCADPRAGGQRHARAALAVARAVLAHLHHAGRAGGRCAVVRRSAPAGPAALRARDAAAVEAALRRHFDDASAHLAGGWGSAR